MATGDRPQWVAILLDTEKRAALISALGGSRRAAINRSAWYASSASIPTEPVFTFKIRADRHQTVTRLVNWLTRHGVDGPDEMAVRIFVKLRDMSAF